MSDWSAASRSPNWTGAAVWVVGIVPLAVLEGRRGGRAGLDVDEEVALEEDARPDLELGVLVDRQALAPRSPSSRSRAPCRSPVTGSTFVTLPTSTPAIRTGELGLMLLAVSKAAVSS